MRSRNLGVASPASGPYVAPCRFRGRAPVAQLDRAPDYESGGRTFESFRARHFSLSFNLLTSDIGVRTRFLVYS